MERFKISLEYREKIGYLVIISLFVVALTGLFRLQVFQHKELVERSENNRIRLEPIIPHRGTVVDRDGNIIIENRPSYTVSVVPSEEVADVTLINLSNLINLDTTQIRKRIRRNTISRYQPALVKRDVPFEVIAVLEEQSRIFPGVMYQLEMVRQYNNVLGAETYTGYVGEVSEGELSQLDEFDYHLGSIIGKKGLEKKYDMNLRGQEGTAYIEVTASGQRLGQLSGKNPIIEKPGARLTLSIDNDLQTACANAFDSFCCGALVAIDPRNGEILAMTSYPGFDANIFSSVIPESLWNEIRTNPSHPLLNRPLTGLYPPGSTVKFVSIGAGLEENLISPSTIFKPCLGGFQFGNRFFKCWLEGGHGSLNAARSLEQSCDVYLYQLGLKLGLDKLYDYYDKCGFGRVTNIDLPGEAAGLNPNDEWYNSNYGVRKWTKGVLLNLSIGQGELLVTPLQLAQFFSGLAQDGVVYKPHLVKKIKYQNRQVVDVQPEISFNLPFSPSTMDVLRRGMRLVVEGKMGTAKALKNDYYTLGGKTGTAQNPHGENHSWFVGVAPLNNPEIVVAAIVENAGHGSEIAAPLVGKIINKYMTKYHDAPDLEVLAKAAAEAEVVSENVLNENSEVEE